MAQRIKKIDGLLKKELGALVLKEINFPENTLVTLERVETAEDLTQTKVFIAVFPNKATAVALKILNSQSYDLHQGLNKRLFLRKVPKLRFFEDKQLAKEQKVEELLHEIEK